MLTIEDINKITAFRGISIKSQNRLLEVANVIDIKKGDVLFWEKDRVDFIYAIYSGKVTMLRYTMEGKRKVIFILDSGTLINETVCNEYPASIVCEAFEDSRLISFNKKLFMQIMENDFVLTKNIMASLGKKQRRLYRQLKNSVSIKVDRKLAAKLWKLSRDYGVPDNSWNRLDLQLSINDLSQMLGSSRETISRSIKILSDLKLIKCIKKEIFVKEDKLLNYYRNIHKT